MGDDNQPKSVKRRKVLRSTVVAGVSALAATGLTTAETDEQLDGLRVTDTTELSDGEAQRNIAKVTGSSSIRDLENTIGAETGLHRTDSLAVAVTTNDETVNDTNPVVVISGYGPEDHDENSAALLMAVIADIDENGGRRGPVAAFGLSAEADADTDVSASSADETDSFSLKGYSYSDDGTPEVVAETSVEANGEVSTQSFHGALGCSACIAIVNELCDKGTGSISRTACLKACAPFLGSVWGYGACGAACIVIVDTINDYGCAVGAATICAAVGVCD